MSSLTWRLREIGRELANIENKFKEINRKIEELEDKIVILENDLRGHTEAPNNV